MIAASVPFEKAGIEKPSIIIISIIVFVVSNSVCAAVKNNLVTKLAHPRTRHSAAVPFW